MKKITIKLILGIATFLAFNGAKAQFPTITSANQLHAIGDSIHYVDLNSFGFDPIPAGGSNVVWNYGSLFAAGTTVDFVYRNPTTEPSASSYPTANASMENSSVAGNEWFLESSSSITRLGLSSPDPQLGDLVYDNGAFIRIAFPFTAGNSWSTPNYTGTQSGDFGVAGATITIASGSFTTSVDAFGTMTLPNGSVHNDVVRTHVIESFEYFADIGVGAPLSLGVISDDYYYWWLEGIKDPIMISGTTLTNGGSPSTVLRYQPILTTGLDAVVVLENNIDVYPNPAKGLFNVSMDNVENGIYTITVLSVLGETVFVKKAIASGNKLNTKINASELNRGIYFITISNAISTVTKKVILK